MVDAAALTGNWTLDPVHSRLGFSARHAMVTKVRGNFDSFEGTAYTDAANPSASRVEVTIQADSINTNNEGRDQHLRTNDFLEVVTYPTITFKSTKVSFAGDMPSGVDGNLTMLGVTKPVSLTFERFKCGSNPFNKKARCGGNAVGKFKRSDFGMKTALPAVGDEIALNIEFEGDKD